MSKCLNLQLPYYIAIDLLPTTSFNTQIISTNSGQEERYNLSMNGRKQYRLQNCKITFQQLTEFHEFFRQCQGRKYSFRMIDYFEYELSDHVIGVGNGEEVEFQISNPSLDKITHIIPGSTTIKIGDDSIVANINYEQGIIKLHTALPVNQTLKVSVKFETICRFDQDSFDYSYHDDGTFYLSDIKLIEILL